MRIRARITDFAADRKRDRSNFKTKKNSLSEPRHSSLDQSTFLQRNLGNRGFQRLYVSEVIQPKLKMNEPGDKYEQEADRVADHVMRMTDEGALHLSQSDLRIQRKSSGCASGGRTRTECADEEEVFIQAKEMTGQTPNICSGLENQINSMKGGGQPLSECTRAFFEPRFGVDFRHVRVHTDYQAGETAKRINARAFTIGGNVVFGAREYSPQTCQGKKLLAHELAHVVQNHMGRWAPALQRKPGPGNKEAREFVEGVMWLMSDSIRQYRLNEHIKYPERHPNTLRQDLEVIRRWFLRARDRVRKELGNDAELQQRLQRIYRIYVYTAIEAFERKLKKPAWKLYREHEDAIDKLAGPPPAGKKKESAIQLDEVDRLVLPRLREALCGTVNGGVEFCGSVIAMADGNFRVTGPITDEEVARCAETLTLSPDERIVAYYHSHPHISTSMYGPADQNLDFSEFDKETADHRRIIYYLVNRNNEVLKYFPKESEATVHGRIVKIHAFQNPDCNP